ncbi:ABC transporter permease [Kutzneria buriramensis]|uniref:Putative ABC transport system permease protein n=1 Tax=Kutzneria buriramensis TaxID=1045776 RepID=A0A3E0GXH2_9PSEU|nr:ABC transporter permease [Kutzneria buriramensis]REH33092.1 putative ABC transport system permease protein [Kutzneria buriramensis]
MLRTVVAGLKARPKRLLLSAVAIMLGVAFVSGALVLADAVHASVRAAVTYQLRGVDADVTVKHGDLDDTVLNQIRQAPGVASAEGRAFTPTPLLVDGHARDAGAIALPADPRLRPFDLAGGRLPGKADEVATAAELGYAPGERVTVFDQNGTQHQYSVVGSFSRPTDAGIGAPQLVLTPDAARQLAPGTAYSEIIARAAPGVSQQQLADSIARTVHGVDVATGEQAASQLLGNAAPDSASLTKFFTAFAVLAMVVAGLVILNSFTILVTQRARELALLRCVGADRSQVFASVLAEAVVVGVVASVVGLFAGLGVAAALQTIIGAQSVYVPLSVRSAVESVAIGVLVTVLAAAVPARAATRVAPVEALRTPLEGKSTRAGRLRVTAAVVAFLVAVGAGALSLGVDTDTGAALAIVAMVALLLAALTIGPVLVGPVVRTLSSVFAPAVGQPAKLAALNADRNPRRTAASAAALTIGLAVVSMVTTTTAGIEAGQSRGLDQQLAADFTVTTAVVNRPLPDNLAGTLARVPGVSVTAERLSFNGDLGSAGVYSMAAVTGSAVGSLLHPAVLSGRLDHLDVGEIAVSKELATETRLKVGDTVAARTPLRVVAVYDSVNAPGVDLGLALVDLAQQQAIAFKGEPGYDESVLVKVASGSAAAQVRPVLEQALSGAPLAQLNTVADIKEQMTTPLRGTLNLLWALTALAVLIAFAGIANTLWLSVLERTRESALLRALGLTRGGLGATVMTESVFVALLGAACGLMVGVASAWMLARVASTDAQPVLFTLPWDRLGVLVAASVLAAGLAALIPARRAARQSLTTAMADR